MKIFTQQKFLFNGFEGREHVAPVGFSDAPDWIAKTGLFEAAVKDGSLKTFEGVSTYGEAEKALAADEKAAYEKRIADLEAQIASNAVAITTETSVVDTVDTVAPVQPEAKVKK